MVTEGLRSLVRSGWSNMSGIGETGGGNVNPPIRSRGIGAGGNVKGTVFRLYRELGERIIQKR